MDVVYVTGFLTVSAVCSSRIHMPRITPSEAVRAIDRDFRRFVNHPLNPGISGADKVPTSLDWSSC